MKYLVIASLVLVSSCSWTGRQADGMMDWADETMPTYDGTRAGLTAKPEAAAPALPGYQGSTSSPASSMRAPATTTPAPASQSSTAPLPITQPITNQPPLGSAVPAPHNFNAATSPTSMPREPDYYDPMIPQPPM